MENTPEVVEKTKEELMYDEVVKVRGMQMKSNCFYETEIESALLNMAMDLGLAAVPDFKSVDDRV
jgi:hypothetical protein